MRLDYVVYASHSSVSLAQARLGKSTLLLSTTSVYTAPKSSERILKVAGVTGVVKVDSGASLGLGSISPGV